jgi:hypothetical protein
MTKHVHSELIKAWADGAEIEVFNKSWGTWESCSPVWARDQQYRVKPPREFPRSTLSYTDLCDLINDAYDLKAKTQTQEGVMTVYGRLVADRAVALYILEQEAKK